MKIEDYEQYWQQDGTYVLPVEVFNELFGELENKKEENQQLKDNWYKLKEWLKEQDIFITEIPAFTKEIGIEHKIMSICYENILDKMEEILKGD